MIPNVLAQRYASAEMVEIWSAQHKIILERRFWLAVLRAQRDLGVAMPDGVVEAYEAVVEKVDLDSIEARERVTKHDVKARIEEFSALAGHEHVHKGLTSRDLTENVEQLQVRLALELVRDRMVAVLARLAARAVEHTDTVMVGRSHNVPAQATTLGKRFASAAEELLLAFERLETCWRPTHSAGSRDQSAHSRINSIWWTETQPRSPGSKRRSPSILGSAGSSRALGRCTRARSTSTWSPRSYRARRRRRACARLSA